MAKKIVITVPGADFSATGLVTQPIYDPIDDLGSDLLAFFDAGEAASLTVDGSGKVTEWESLVGSLALTPFNSSYKPDYLAEGWGAGQAAVDFTTGAGTTGTVLTNTSGPVNDAGMSLFVVAKRGTQLDGSAVRMRPAMQVPACLESGVRQQGLLGVWSPTVDPSQNNMTAGGFTGNNFGNNSNVAGFGVNDKGLLYGEFPNSDNIKGRLNGGSAGSTASWYDVSNDSKWSLGGMWSASDASFDGLILMALAVKGVPDTATRQKLEGYCMWRAGIQSQLPAGHPYRDVGPYA
ncbi:hypothetical protein A3711_09055 [Erythrobacter sp. HI00D59]|nr:hypothetical protein A3711_09055 [Erythrobacter sp. HI00D59]